jgi:ABC-2 type transport system permease protein
MRFALTYSPMRVADEPLAVIAGPAKDVGGFIPTARAIIRRRDLVARLVSRETKAKYKDSALGVGWALGRPLIQLAIYYFVIGQFLGASRAIPDFAIYVFTGLTVWSFFSEVITMGTNSIVGNSGLIKKVSLPREIFPLAALGSAAFNFVIQFAVLLVATLLLGKFPAHPQIVYAVASAGIIAIYGLALGLLLSAWNVYLRDTQHLVDVALVVLFWLSPIVYSYGMTKTVLGDGIVSQIFAANPVSVAVFDMQRAIWIAGSANPGQAWPPNLLELNAGVLVFGVLLLWVCQRVFSRLQANFAQEL